MQLLNQTISMARLFRFVHKFLLVIVFTVFIPVYSATYTVTSTNDSGPGSFRATLFQSNQSPGPHIINFSKTGNWSEGGSVKLVLPLPIISNSVSIYGWKDLKQVNRVILIGAALTVENGCSVSFDDVSITGGITNNGNLVVRRCDFNSGNVTTSGVLQMDNCQIFNATSYGLFNNGTAVLNGVQIKGSVGPGVVNHGIMSILNSDISLNSNMNNGGGILSTNSISISSTRIVGNSAANGGGVFNVGKMFLSQVDISNNSAGIGGGVCNLGSVSGDQLLISRNVCNARNGEKIIYLGVLNGRVPDECCKATVGTGGGSGLSPYYPSLGVGGTGSLGGGYGQGQPGGFGAGGGGGTGAGGPGGFGGGKGGNGGVGYVACRAAGGGGGALGGGLINVSGITQVTNATIANNVCVGGNGGEDGIFGGDGGGGGAGLGGGILVFGGDIKLINCTVVHNSCSGGKGGRGADNGSGIGAGLLVLTNSTCQIYNTIVAENTASSNSPDVFGLYISKGNNFVGSDAGSKGWDLVTDYLNSSPLMIQGLADNGGFMFTAAIAKGSLCILAGGKEGSPNFDQRGVIRPNGQIDIGAYQFSTVLSSAVSWENPAPIVYGTALSSKQLNATANVGGIFSYYPPIGTVLNAGNNQTLTAVFTSADPTSYQGSTNKVAIDVLQAPQSIDFPVIPPQIVGAPFYTLNAKASSGLPVTYELVSGPALLAGNILAVGNSPGIVVLRASQFGNSNYLAAPTIQISFLLERPSAPIVTVQPQSLTGNFGDTIVFSAAATTAPLTYQWQFGSIDLPGETNSTLTIRNFQNSNIGSYRVVISNPFASTTSATAVLTLAGVTGGPIITSQPKGATVRIGETTVVTVEATGNSPLSYKWFLGQKGDRNLPVGANSSSFTTPALTIDTSYWVAVENSLGVVQSDVVTIKVVPSHLPKLGFRFLGSFSVISVDGKTGTNYVIEACSDLSKTNWTTISSFKMISNPYTFFDTDSINMENRYYRAYVP